MRVAVRLSGPIVASFLVAACGGGGSGTGGGGATSSSSSSGATSTSSSSSSSSGATSTSSSSSGSTSSSSSSGSTSSSSSSGAPADPCPTLTTPTTCYGRSVVYREWGPNAVGDGSFFADQAPGRLGFNRTQGTIWITKLRLEANTYRGMVSADGDQSGGIAWISDQPCDVAFADQSKLEVYGAKGGGSLPFLVAADDAAAAALSADPLYQGTPQLRGDHCYYLMFENVADFPMSLPLGQTISTSQDNCAGTPGGSCYYLAQDFNHRLHDITTNQVIAGNVLPGYTAP